MEILSMLSPAWLVQVLCECKEIKHHWRIHAQESMIVITVRRERGRTLEEKAQASRKPFDEWLFNTMWPKELVLSSPLRTLLGTQELVWSSSSCLSPLMHLTGQVEFLHIIFICFVDKWHLMTAGLFHCSISFFISSSLGHHPGTCGYWVSQPQDRQRRMRCSHIPSSLNPYLSYWSPCVFFSSSGQWRSICSLEKYWLLEIVRIEISYIGVAN